MSLQYDTDAQEQSRAQEESQFWAEQLARYLAPYHERLDAYLDRRVVGNLTATVAAIVQSRSELTTSELGSAICGPAHADAGTQRLQRALHHPGWEAEVIAEVLWQEADKSRQQMQQQGETPLCIWDSSVLEKPESEQLQGLGTVRSSRVRRLARSRKGLFNRPSRLPVSVRGFEWESLLLLGSRGVPQVVAMKWWGRQKGVPGQQRKPQLVLLSQVAQRWGRQVRHVFDGGSGNGPWLWQLWRYQLRFAVRWKKGNKLIDACGQERKAWEIARGKRAWGEARLLWDTHCRVYRSTRVLARPLRQPQYRGPLWLVVVRQGRGREPWYLLTNEAVQTSEQAWDIVFSYVRSFQIEESFRFQTCELQIGSLRLQGWQARRKMLLLVTMAYGFLLAGLSAPLWLARCTLLLHWCPPSRLALVEGQSAPLSPSLGSGKPIPHALRAGTPIVGALTSPGLSALYPGGPRFGTSADICSKTLLWVMSLLKTNLLILGQQKTDGGTFPPFPFPTPVQPRC